MFSIMDNRTKPSASQKVTRPELYWLLGAIIAGSIFRLAFPERMAVEHFDEGVYASNFWFGAENDYSYPARFLYAPPLLPAAIEWTMILASLVGLRPSGVVPLIPSLVTGIAMVPSAWWICRRWFGPTAGLVTAWLIALSDFHASYSRAALTDVPVCLFILWAVHFTGKAFASVDSAGGSSPSSGKGRSQPARWSPPWREIMLAGGLTGLSWWTKYNGWLPLAIGLTGGVVWQIALPRSERQVSRTLICWLLIALTAMIAWSPVLWGLQKQGGYAKVATNHRQYIVGTNGWIRSAQSQADIVRMYDNPLSAPFSRDQLIMRHCHDSAQKSHSRSLLEMLSLLLHPVGTLTLSVAVCSIGVLKSRFQDSKLPASLALAWLVGMSISTPFYHPYPRLILPWLCSVWICLGMVFEFCSRKVRKDDENNSVPGMAAAMCMAALLAIATFRQLSGSGFAWADRTDLQSTSGEIATAVRAVNAREGFPADEAIIYVMGEPALVFGLKSEGILAIGPVQDLGFANQTPQRPTFVAVPSRASSVPAEVRSILESTRFSLQTSVSHQQSHLVLLDDLHPDPGPDPGPGLPLTEWKLYRLNK